MSIKSTVKAATALVAVKTHNVRDEFKLAKDLASQGEQIDNVKHAIERAKAKVDKAADNLERQQEKVREAETELEIAKEELRATRDFFSPVTTNQATVDA